MHEAERETIPVVLDDVEIFLQNDGERFLAAAGEDTLIPQQRR
jgi:hypothetical protein